MDYTTTNGSRSLGSPEPHSLGHWLPSLRPDDDDAAPYPEPIAEEAQPVQRVTGPQSLQHHSEGLPQSELKSPTESIDPDSSTSDNAAGHTITEQTVRSLLAPSHPAAPMSAPPRQHSFALYDEDEMEDDGDPERLDPAWGIQRMKTSEILGSVHRSSSFPAFTPTIPINEPATSVVHSAQDVNIADDQNALQDEKVEAIEPAFAAQTQPFEWNSRGDSETDQLFNESDPVSPGFHFQDPEESRYEEGLPLMQNQDSLERTEQSTSMSEPSKLQTMLEDPEDLEDASFFNNTAADVQNPHIALTRKDTSALLGALHMEPRPHDEPTSEEQEFFSQLQPKDISEPIPDEKNDPDEIWQAMAEDDEFLVEDPDDLLPDSEPSSPSFEASLKGTDDLQEQGTPHDLPLRPVPPRTSSSVYTPHQPTTSELSQLSPTYQSIGLTQVGLGSRPSFQPQLQEQRPAAPQQTSSFADQAKGGYKSPYDLPMELSKPKKRPAVLQQPSATGKVIPPPPRSSSITDKPLQSPFTPNMQTGPQSSPGFPPRAASSSNTSSAQTKSSSFFEELPVTAKPRQVSVGGRYTPQQNARSLPPPPMASPSSALPQQHLQSPPPQDPQVPSGQSSDPYAQFQLRPPERMDPFSNQPLQLPAASSAPPAVVSNRYSPAPPNTLTAPRTGPSPRYSPAPPSQPSNVPVGNRYASQSGPPLAQAPPQTNRYSSQPVSAPSPPVPSLPFQPRTSSPLVHQKSIDATGAPKALVGSQSQPGLASRYDPQGVSSPSIDAQMQNEPQQTIYSSPPGPNQIIQPPRRSQTQSPSKQRPQPAPPAAQRPPGFRPASAHGHVAPMRALSEYTPTTRHHIQGRAPVEQVEFVLPTDELGQDPLARWKGAPVFKFGFGGKVISTFPKHVPRFSAGAARPLIKATVGDVSLREVKDVVSVSSHLTGFPGPLRAKSKKKELLTWLNSSISHLEGSSAGMSLSRSLPDPRKRHDERILLWKIVKSMVEHDGALDSGEALKAVNTILAPDIHAVDEATATQYREDISTSVYRPSGTNARADFVDPMTLDAVRKHLLRGNRKEAVWHAVDNRLWSHAFLIASTMPRDTWKQVVQEFVKQEVKTAGENTESLSTLYEIFAGNAEDCVDQLVPPSARAGLQMVSKVDTAGPTKNAVDALDKWRETLTLVINNRSHGDHQALSSLGRLLAEYGRIEAAHICFLFSRSAANPTIVGALDDPQASIVLLGTDHRKQPYDFARDREAILLTEVYEFATLVLTGSATSFMPFLSTYKLHHASLLAEEGFKTEAQAYCDSLTSTLRSAKVSAYYAPAFLGELEDFSNRLKQVPVQASSSWMGKPNLEKVSGSLLSKLSNFVAGEDSDADSKGSTREAGESGPFAKIAGSPSLSRTASQSELVGYPTSTPQPLPSTIAGSRYAPNGIASARSSSELTRGRPSLDSQRSPASGSYANGRPSPYEPINMMQQGVATPPANPYQSFASPPTNRYQATPPQSSYMPHATSAYSPAKAEDSQESYIPTPPPEQLQAPYETTLIQQPTYEPSYHNQQPPYETSTLREASYNAPTQPQSPYEGSPQPFAQLEGASQSLQQRAYEPSPLNVKQPSFGGYAPPEQATAFMPPSNAEGDISGYARPTDSYGYAPPEDTGYTPYVPEPDSPEQKRPKKSQLDDDDDYPRVLADAASPQVDDSAAQKAANDAAADAAFRAAAEADAAKGKTIKPKSSGWFGGWLPGSKKSDSLDAGTPKSGKEPTVHRAKLGESKMKLYYDKDLKKWVNPDNPDVAKSTPTPPPPRAASGTPSTLGASMAPPPRSVSAAPPMSSPALMAPGSGPPSRAGTPASGNGAPGIAATLPPIVAAALGEKGPGPAPPSGPPSRPGTAVSNASSIDDLLGGGPPLGGKRPAKGAKAKKGRYVDVMAK